MELAALVILSLHGGSVRNSLLLPSDQQEFSTDTELCAYIHYVLWQMNRATTLLDCYFLFVLEVGYKVPSVDFSVTQTPMCSAKTEPVF